MDFVKESSNDSESNQVLTYFKKYSQNPELSKYFSGPEASISISANCTSKNDPTSINKTSTSKDHIDSTSSNPNILQVNKDEDTEHRNISPSSSIASIKKLEWDNGADIGYSNSYKHSTKKSASFPSLFVNDMSYFNEDNSVSRKRKHVRSMYHQLTFSPEPSGDSSKAEISHLKTEQTVDSSSNEVITEEHCSVSSCSEKNKLYLQKRIGKPNAYSTPYDEVCSKSSDNDLYSETPVIRTHTKPKRNFNEKSFNTSSGSCAVYDKKDMLHKGVDNCELISNSFTNETNQPSNGNQCSEEEVQQVNKVQREINLCLTKPIFVECIYAGDKQTTNKKSQTGFISGKNSKSIQTEFLQNDKKIIHLKSNEVCSPQIQKIEYVEYESDETSCNITLDKEKHLKLEKSDIYLERSSEERLSVGNDIPNVEDSCKRKSLKITTNVEDAKTFSDIKSKNNPVRITNKYSFNYIHDKSRGIEIVNPIKCFPIINSNHSKNSQETLSDESNCGQIFQKFDTPVKENSPVTFTKSLNDEMVLAEMISLNHSRDLNTDIKRSINILQKLLSSKKYDESTKKYYIKKIVEKIVESKYSDDSTSSSELFRPKKDNLTELSKKEKSQIDINKSVKPIKPLGNKNQLMQNVPWYPVHDIKYLSKNNSMDCKATKTDLNAGVKQFNSISQCFSKDNINGNATENIEKRLVENSVCNIADTPKIDRQPSGPIIPKQPTQTDFTDKINDKNWKDVKTLSERLLEKKNKIGQGDYLLHVATNERQHQLSWIKNEIKHLNTLKDMLERKVKSKPGMECVMSSLLEMQVDDMKGLPKNHNVFICSKCSTSKVQCKCDCIETQSRNQAIKKCAEMVSGYYTIQTQLDRNGNLLDLTVFDEKGTKTYNYQHDGKADNVFVTSNNRNTSIKLKPNAAKQIGYMKSKQFKGRDKLLSAPVDKPEVCCCFKLANANLLKETSSSSEKNLQKQIKLELEPVKLSKKPQNICICKKCLTEVKQSNQDRDNAVCTFQQSSSTSSFNYNIDFIKPNRDSHVVCNKYADLITKSESESSLQKIGLRSSIALDESACINEEFLRCANENQKPSLMESSTATFPDEDSDKSDLTKEPPNGDTCPRCRRKSLRCICFPKFVPKKPKLIGTDASSPKFIPTKQQRGATIGKSYQLDLKPPSDHKSRTPETLSSSSDSKSDSRFPPAEKVPLNVSVSKQANVKQKKKQIDSTLERRTLRSTSCSIQSQLEPLGEMKAGSEKIDNQAKKVQCCTACKSCNSATTSPRMHVNYQDSNVVPRSTTSSKDNERDESGSWKCHLKVQDLKPIRTTKKSCQCCTCNDCGSQTKRLLGDRNARCQCCVCENCGTQASLDGNNRKPVLSKWCQPNQAKMHVERTTAKPYSEKSPYGTQIINNRFEVYSSSHTRPRNDFRNAQGSNEDSSSEQLPNYTSTGGVVPAQTNKKVSKKCCCDLSECKCNQTSTHEAKHVQYSAYKQCICQTESKEDTSNGCSCKAAVDVSCECSEKPCKCAKKDICKCQILSTSSSSSSSSTSKSLMSCICCKKETLIKNLMNKLPLCNPCQEINQKHFYPYEYSNPLHSCLCYSLVEQNTLFQLKSTLTELERLDVYQQYCEILKNCKCCKDCGCKCKLPKKFKNGFAYFLKLEDACPHKCEDACKCEDSSEKYDEDGETKQNYLPEVTVKVPNCRGPCAQKKKREFEMQESCPSIMAYLCTMKPDFIERAERRRTILRTATLQREEDVETRKLKFLNQVNFLNEKYQKYVPNQNKVYSPYGCQTAAYCVFDSELNAPSRNVKPRVFKSFREMRELTRKRYLHLSEVRNKKDVYKNKRLKEANRILANTFNKRLQRSTLKGNVDIPPCVRIISY